MYDNTLNPSCRNPGRRDKINLNFYFLSSCSDSKGFLKAIKAIKTFINPFEALQKSV